MMKTSKPEVWRLELDGYHPEEMEMEKAKVWNGMRSREGHLKPYVLVLGLKAGEMTWPDHIRVEPGIFCIEVYVFDRSDLLKEWVDWFGRDRCLEINYGD